MRCVFVPVLYFRKRRPHHRAATSNLRIAEWRCGITASQKDYWRPCHRDLAIHEQNRSSQSPSLEQNCAQCRRGNSSLMHGSPLREWLPSYANAIWNIAFVVKHPTTQPRPDLLVVLLILATASWPCTSEWDEVYSKEHELKPPRLAVSDFQ